MLRTEVRTANTNESDAICDGSLSMAALPTLSRRMAHANCQVLTKARLSKRSGDAARQKLDD